MNRPILPIAAAVLAIVFSAGTASAQLGGSLEAQTDGSDEGKRPWRGSFLQYQHSMTAISADKSAEPMWNPVYVHGITIQPQRYFGDSIVARLGFSIEQELTNSDYTTKYREFEWSDLSLELVWTGWVEPATDIRISGGLRGIGAISKISRARSLVGGLSPSVTLSRRFDVLNGLTAAVATRYTQRFYDSTTGQYDGHGIVGCDKNSCDALTNTGVRNSPWDVSVGPSLTLGVTGEFTLSSSFILVRQRLYSIGDAEIEIDGPTVAVSADEDGTNTRYLNVFSLGASYLLFDDYQLSLGINTAAPELAPDSTRYFPVLNRYTVVYLGLGVDVDALASKL
ncbi:MAG TPA: hypothetical protein VN033_14890 [Vulgatibacter sp.]|nr:hypothetical protein [Vulgatibacter sp.]